jgi:hypothetical protein
MYHNYWEENENPYFEYGSPSGPNAFFRTNTPAAPGRQFFEGPIMGVRRQYPDTITWLGWNRPTIGHEAELRKFAQAFRALPVVDPLPFVRSIGPAEVVARWHSNRLAVISDSPARTITLRNAIPAGGTLVDVVPAGTSRPTRRRITASLNAG